MLFMSLITWLWKFVSVWCRGHKPTTAPETVLRTSKTVFNLLYTLCEIIYELLSTNDGTTADPPPFFYYHGRVRSTKEKCRLNWARVTPCIGCKTCAEMSSSCRNCEVTCIVSQGSPELQKDVMVEVNFVFTAKHWMLINWLGNLIKICLTDESKAYKCNTCNYASFMKFEFSRCGPDPLPPSLSVHVSLPINHIYFCFLCWSMYIKDRDLFRTSLYPNDGLTILAL